MTDEDFETERERGVEVDLLLRREARVSTGGWTTRIVDSGSSSVRGGRGGIAIEEVRERNRGGEG